MASSLEFIEFVCEEIREAGFVRYKKMFGEYMVYINEKPMLLVCDNVVYIKMLPELENILSDAEKGTPYQGAKEHYILDIEDTEKCLQVISILEPITKIPQKKKTSK